MVKRNCTKLKIGDFRKYPIWEYLWDESDDDGNTMVEAVKKLPVESLTSKNIVGLQVRLANGSLVWASLENIESKHPKATEHFIGLGVERDGIWVHLERYFDPMYEVDGPKAFAKKLGLKIDEVFPILYDVQPYVTMISVAHRGVIFKEPREKLSDEDLHKLNTTSSLLDTQ